MPSQPFFSGLRSDTYYQDEMPTQPFQGTTLTDNNPGATDALTIGVEGGGSLQGAGLTQTGPSAYALPPGSAEAVTAYLQGLTFQPAPVAPGGTASARFTLAAASSAGTSASSSFASVTFVVPPPADSLAVDTIDYADGDFALTGHVTSYRGAAQVFVQPGGGAAPSILPVAADGSFAATLPSGGFQLDAQQPTGDITASTSVSLLGDVTGARYVAQAQQYLPGSGSSERASETFFRADGSRRVDVQATGQTFTANFFDTFQNHETPDNTFVFDPGHGLDVVQQFRVDGTDHDTLSFLGSDFGGDVASVLRNTRTVAGSAVITDPTTGDAVRLGGVTKAQLVQNPGDIAFHG